MSAIPKKSLVHRAGRERGSLTWRQLHSRAAPGSGGLGRGGLQHQRHLRSIKETGAARLEPGTQCTATADVQSTFLFWNISFWSEVQMSNRLWRTMEGGQALNVRPPNVQSIREGYGEKELFQANANKCYLLISSSGISHLTISVSTCC